LTEDGENKCFHIKRLFIFTAAGNRVIKYLFREQIEALEYDWKIGHDVTQNGKEGGQGLSGEQH
jgi:hypothetical protein